MNRRRFLSNLAVGAAALMLRFAPDAAATIPRGVRFSDHGLDDGEYEVHFLSYSGTFERLVPVAYDGETFKPVPYGKYASFAVKDGIITLEL